MILRAHRTDPPLRKPLLCRLLSYVGTEGADPSPLALTQLDERQFEWALEGGLGALIYRAVEWDSETVQHPWHDLLHAAELSARVRHLARVDAAIDVLDTCEAVGAPVTLLKGISISEQCYSAPHTRPMSDIDLLIPADAYVAVEAALLEQGVEKAEFPTIDGFHHGPPLRDAARDAWIELHVALFPGRSPLRQGRLFAAADIPSRAVGVRFRGREAFRLADELQLAYIASSWMNDVTHCRIHPSFAVALFDATLLLRTTGSQLDWDRLISWLDNETAAASLHLMLSYIGTRGHIRVPPDALRRIASRQRLVGKLQLRLVHAMVDRYLIAGQPWDLPLPPPVPGRYDIRTQIQKRVVHAWRERRTR